MDGGQGAGRSPRRPRRSPRPRPARNRAERDSQIADESVRDLEAASNDLSSPPILDPPPSPALVPSTRSSRRSGATAWRAMNCSTRSSKGIGLIQKRLRRALAAEQVEQIPCEGNAGRSRAHDRDRSRRRTARPARDRGQGAEARLYLEGPRDPLRGSSGGSRGLEIAGRTGRAKTRRRLEQDEIDVETERHFRNRGSVRLDSDQARNDDMDSDTIIGIDLGTTNSEVAIIRDGRPVVLEEDGDPILPSVVGLDPQGHLLVGKAARNQYVLAPERTVRSIKRKMGQEVTVTLGDQKYSPQEISAIILRTLKHRAEKALGTPVSKVVITVPAFFNDGQRQATRQAGELAGLEVVRIINEPTAAVLTYDPHPPEMERLWSTTWAAARSTSRWRRSKTAWSRSRPATATPSSGATISTSCSSTTSATRSPRSTAST